MRIKIQLPERETSNEWVACCDAKEDLSRLAIAVLGWKFIESTPFKGIEVTLKAKSRFPP